MEGQSGLSELSIISWMSAFQGCPLRGVPLYSLSYTTVQCHSVLLAHTHLTMFKGLLWIMCHYAVDKQATPAAFTQDADTDTHTQALENTHYYTSQNAHQKFNYDYLAYVSCFKIHCQDSLKATSQPIDKGEFPLLASINKLCVQRAASDLPVFDHAKMEGESLVHLSCESCQCLPR